MTRRGAALSIQATPIRTTYGRQTPKLGSPFDVQNLFSCAMDQALGIERASLSTVVQLNSSVLDIYRNSLWLTPVFSDLLHSAAKAFGFYVDLQTSWLRLMLPYATPVPETVLHCAAPGSAAESSPDSGVQMSAEEVERSMEIAIGLAG